MSEEGVPPFVRAFITEHIDSVMQLELLLLLEGQPQRRWTAAELAQELRVDPAWVEPQLRRMAGVGLLETAEPQGGAVVTHRFAPRTPELRDAAAGLAAAYADRRVTVISLIFSKPTDTLRTFADAFRLRKD